MRAINITIAIIAAAICSVTLNATNNFVYNTESNEAGTSTQVVYKMDESGKYLTPHLKYNISYDAQSRMEQKEVLRWDSHREAWVNQHTFCFGYDNDIYTIECAKWNENTGKYSDLCLKSTYTIDSENNTCRYESFRLDNQAQGWELTQAEEFSSEIRNLYANN